ncbi:class III signal peptide-containing protein [archaeon]
MKRGQGSLEYLLIFAAILAIGVVVVLVANAILGAPSESLVVQEDKYNLALAGFEVIGYDSPFDPTVPDTLPKALIQGDTDYFYNDSDIPDDADPVGKLTDSGGNKHTVWRWGGGGGGGGGSYNVDPPLNPSVTPTPVPCTSDDNCTSGDWCVDGDCVEKPECTSDDNCTGTDFCFEGACVGCTSDDNCTGTDFCFEGACVECASDDNCITGDKCFDGGCVTPECDDEDPELEIGCADDEKCVGYKCIERCGDDVTDTGEECDGTNLNSQDCLGLDYTGGTLGCLSDCRLNITGCTGATCGDTTVGGGEQCDGSDLDSQTCQTLGYDLGTLKCYSDNCRFNDASCYDAHCGNLIIEGTEECEWVDLDNQNCTSLNYTSGELSCTDCLFNTSQCIGATCDGVELEDGEECDGGFFNLQNCTTLGYDAGVLACSDGCRFNETGCYNNTCGTGVCELDKGEDCITCPSDCLCGSEENCVAGSCEDACGSGGCQGELGENCDTCLADCACSGEGEFCSEGECVTCVDTCTNSGMCYEWTDTYWSEEDGFWSEAECGEEGEGGCSVSSEGTDDSGKKYWDATDGCDKRCNGDYVLEACGDYDNDGCTEWGAVKTCGTGVCKAGWLGGCHAGISWNTYTDVCYQETAQVWGETEDDVKTVIAYADCDQEEGCDICNTLCGDGRCDRNAEGDLREDCNNCPEDCGCASWQNCNNYGTCVDYCGNGHLLNPEQCDGNAFPYGVDCTNIHQHYQTKYDMDPQDTTQYFGGELKCTSNCKIDTSSCTRCGDNVKTGTEDCDGTDFLAADCNGKDPYSSTFTCIGLTKPERCYGGLFTSDWKQTADARSGGWFSYSSGTGGWTCLSSESTELCSLETKTKYSGGMFAIKAKWDKIKVSGSTGFPTMGFGVYSNSRHVWSYFTNGINQAMSASSANSLGGTKGYVSVDPTNWHVYSVVWNPGGNTYYYVDGVLKHTETSNVEPNPLAITMSAHRDINFHYKWMYYSPLDCLGDCRQIGYAGGALTCDTFGYGKCTYPQSQQYCYKCGDWRVSSGEQCDSQVPYGKTCVTQGYDGGTLKCGDQCKFDYSSCHKCGDGKKEGPEECDGEPNCDSSCKIVSQPLCGNGNTEGIEQCDNGQYQNSVSGSCPNCQNAKCGDGNIWFAQGGTEQCDGTDMGPWTDCTDFGYKYGTISCSSCMLNLRNCYDQKCGDGIIDGTEECDGSKLNGATCQTLGYDGGTLQCHSNRISSTACTYQPSECTYGTAVIDDTCSSDSSCVSGYCKSGKCASDGSGAIDDSCNKNDHCALEYCKSSKCTTPTCTDNVKNGDESDVDCGGSCTKCARTESCTTSSDCLSANCVTKTCDYAVAKDFRDNFYSSATIPEPISNTLWEQLSGYDYTFKKSTGGNAKCSQTYKTASRESCGFRSMALYDGGTLTIKAKWKDVNVDHMWFGFVSENGWNYHLFKETASSSDDTKVVAATKIGAFSSITGTTDSKIIQLTDQAQYGTTSDSSDSHYYKIVWNPDGNVEYYIIDDKDTGGIIGSYKLVHTTTAHPGPMFISIFEYTNYAGGNDKLSIGYVDYDLPV